MAHTAARVNPGGYTYRDGGAEKTTVTDVTVSTNSEVVTAAELGLTTINLARGDIQTGQATDTGVYVTAAVAGGGASITLAEFTAAGAAATTAANTVIRVWAWGF